MCLAYRLVEFSLEAESTDKHKKQDGDLAPDTVERAIARQHGPEAVCRKHIVAAAGKIQGAHVAVEVAPTERARP